MWSSLQLLWGLRRGSENRRAPSTFRQRGWSGRTPRRSDACNLKRETEVELALAIVSTVRYIVSVKQPLSDLGSFIREQRERSAMSLRKLADVAGISNPYLSQIERGLRNPSAEILKSIARALSIRAESLYERAGLLEGIERPSVIEAVQADQLLQKSQKEALMQIYNSFINDNNTEEE